MEKAKPTSPDAQRLCRIPRNGVALSGRVQAETLGRIDGIDPLIVGPVQTANPDFQGGVPIVQDLNVPQMPTDYTLTLGVQKSFQPDGWRSP